MQQEPGSLQDRLAAALSKVMDPELRRPITELGMVHGIDVEGSRASIGVLLTVQGCPMSDTIEADVRDAALGVEGIDEVDVDLGVMTPQARRDLVDSLKRHVVPFTQPGSLTRIIAVSSGKGGVGKSSVTVNLAVAAARLGLRVGVIDADVLGFSVPGLMGLTDASPTRVDELIVPPVAHGVKVMSIGMFLNDNAPVMWRGPMLHRALEQFVTDVHFGDLDVLFLDLPPGTGDVAISLSQLLPGAEHVVVTTPQHAAAEVAERAGAMALQTGGKVLGVVENMSWIELPGGERMTPFGEGGGHDVARRLSAISAGAGAGEVPLLAQVPLEATLREGGDTGVPVVLGAPDSAAARALAQLASTLVTRPRGLAGRSLPVTPR